MIQQVVLKPQDHIVITARSSMTGEQAEALKRIAEERWPGHVVSVLRNVEMAVVQEETA